MFQVEWIQLATDELADLWTESNSALRQAITATTHVLDQQLAADHVWRFRRRGEGWYDQGFTP